MRLIFYQREKSFILVLLQPLSNDLLLLLPCLGHTRGILWVAGSAGVGEEREEERERERRNRGLQGEGDTHKPSMTGARRSLHALRLVSVQTSGQDGELHHQYGGQ